MAAKNYFSDALFGTMLEQLIEKFGELAT